MKIAEVKEKNAEIKAKDVGHKAELKAKDLEIKKNQRSCTNSSSTNKAWERQYCY